MSMSSKAREYIGIKELSKQHKKIVDTYNTIKPLPHEYKVSYYNSWCAVFVSFIELKCKVKNAVYDCNCVSMLLTAKKKGLFKKEPKKNYIIFYSWNCNGVAEHVGIVEKVDGDIITTIEGNYSDVVKRRRINKTSKFIIGYAKVN